MFGSFGKRFFLSMIPVSLFVPVLIMLWHPQIGLVAFLIGAMIAMQCVQVVRAIHIEGALGDQQALVRRQNQAQTIFVQLTDDAGNDLAPDLVQAKLAAAQQQAGPRDMVVGVRHKVP